MSADYEPNGTINMQDYKKLLLWLWCGYWLGHASSAADDLKKDVQFFEVIINRQK